MKEEIWKKIEGFEYYEVSNLGRVKSLKFGKEKMLNNNILSSGYYFVNLRKFNKSKTYTIHQLVAITFLNHKPNGFKIVVDHINNVKTDNRVDNLQLISNRENTSKDRIGSSKYIGAYLDKQTGKWKTQIQIGGKKVYLGYFTSEEEASEAYKNALKAIENNEEIITTKRIKSSIYTGVSWCKINKKWRSTIRINGKRKHLGLFTSELEAHQAYQNKLKEIQNEG